MLSRYFLWSFIVSTALVAMTFFSSCTPDEEITDTPSGSGNVPSLTTVPVSNITSASATSGGTITSTGGSAITQRGVVWGTTPNPTTANSSTNDGSGSDNYTSNLSGITVNTTYYVRAYATNSAGTAYGNELTFTTEWLNPNLDYDSVTDADGNNYATIVIGNQEWMAENLRTTLYANGDPIPNVLDANQWISLNTGAWVHNNNESQYEIPYGKLYNWYAVDDSRNICPTGWHVPSDAEWSELIDHLDPNADGGNNLPNTAGGKMKSAQYWISPNQDANNESGFSGVPGGKRDINGNYDDGSIEGYWWSSTEDGSNEALYIDLSSYVGWAGRNRSQKIDGSSVRCIRD
jgi:uncharacterized protein (TIGR02145 family)